MAFLGDLGKVFGLGSSKQVLGDVGGFAGNIFGVEGAGRRAGELLAGATSSLSTADQPLEQSAVPTGDPKQGRAQETSRTGSQTRNIINVGSNRGQMSEAGLGALAPLLQTAGRFLSSRGGQIATGVGTGALFGGMGQEGRMKPVLTQSRRNKAKVRQLVNFMGIEGAAEFLSQSSGQDVSGNDVVMLLLRTFRNDGAFITKAQVRNLRRTTNRFKSLEKQVKEATSMSRTTRRAPVRRASSTTLIKN